MTGKVACDGADLRVEASEIDEFRGICKWSSRPDNRAALEQHANWVDVPDSPPERFTRNADWLDDDPPLEEVVVDD